jgi:ankyrin repeat protein
MWCIFMMYQCLSAMSYQQHQCLNNKNMYSETMLMNAVSTNDVDRVRCLIEQGADVDVQDKYGYTALMRAAYLAHVPILRMLIDVQANLNLQTFERKWTALMYALVSGRYDSVQMLYAAGASIPLGWEDAIERSFFMGPEQKMVMKILVSSLVR